MRDIVAVTQRVMSVPDVGERRDALDHRWTVFLDRCGLLPLALPNHPAAAAALLTEVPVRGLLLTGGDDLSAYGGDAPERDETEERLLEIAIARQLPTIAVCRGLQLLLHHHGAALFPVDGHVTPRHPITLNGARYEVNSYHRFAGRDVPDPLELLARADDGTVEAVRCRRAPVTGIMWHPERYPEPEAIDLDLFRTTFGGVL
jgi:gamma-glutamyl-gamma-aminobutyrate hydrolase PuuD